MIAVNARSPSARTILFSPQGVWFVSPYITLYGFSRQNCREKMRKGKKKKGAPKGPEGTRRGLFVLDRRRMSRHEQRGQPRWRWSL